jgi:hypothetical protein
MSESADARYLASVLLLCFTALTASLTALFAGGLVAWIIPLLMFVLTAAHGFEDREQTAAEADPHPGVGE